MAEKVERRGYGDYYGSKGVTLTANGFRFTESSYRVDERLPNHEHEQPHFCYVVAGRYDGFPFELYEANLRKGSGKSEVTVFRGVIVAFEASEPFQVKSRESLGNERRRSVR